MTPSHITNLHTYTQMLFLDIFKQKFVLSLCQISPTKSQYANTVVKLLCYKSEGRWFDSRWYHWNFSLT